MLDRFRKLFRSGAGQSGPFPSAIEDGGDLLRRFGGQSFQRSAYRVVGEGEVAPWNERVSSAFPEFRGRITCFGYDWLGRAFALDDRRAADGEPAVLMFEPGTGEVLEIPCTLKTFHEHEIPAHADAVLAIDFHAAWLQAGGAEPNHAQCIGYRKPLYLGGDDTVENLELADLEVYWTLAAQLLAQVRGLPAGTHVKIKGPV